MSPIVDHGASRSSGLKPLPPKETFRSLNGFFGERIINMPAKILLLRLRHGLTKTAFDQTSQSHILASGDLADPVQ
jgi:hypothetical protein